ncbi:MAG: hypothetical protein ACJ788_01565 [Ktedonobacteraceae bacterium]
MAKKMCEQCHAEKDIEFFRKVTNQYTGVHPMSICKECYNGNQEARQLQQAKEQEARAAAREQRQRERTEREAYEERVRLEQEHLARQHAAIEGWYLQQPDRQCNDCKRVLAASAFGYTTVKERDGFWFPASLHKRCKPCHEAYRKGNRHIYPRCPLCNTSSHRSNFLPEYQGYHLDLIDVCCKQCISQFEARPVHEQLDLLRRAMIAAYGNTAVIYALQYDDHFPCQHIGRTKNYERRMADYKRDWYRGILRHFILHQLAFGPLSMEYESRWMMHALKHRWPIDNFALFKSGEDGLSGMRQQARLTEAVQAFEPLTAPFEVVGPLLRENFQNTSDAHIVNWYCSQYDRRAYPSEQEMAQRIMLMERLHGLSGS